MPSPQAKPIDDLFETFEMLSGDWEERYRVLIDLGRRLPELPESQRTEANRVHGCQSQVWMTAGARASASGPLLELRADSDAFIVRGLIAVLFMLYDGLPLAEVRGVDADGAFRRLGLDQHLSPTRRNGLHAMIQRVRDLAVRAA